MIFVNSFCFAPQAGYAAVLPSSFSLPTSLLLHLVEASGSVFRAPCAVAGAAGDGDLAVTVADSDLGCPKRAVDAENGDFTIVDSDLNCPMGPVDAGEGDLPVVDSGFEELKKLTGTGEGDFPDVVLKGLGTATCAGKWNLSSDCCSLFERAGAAGGAANENSAAADFPFESP